MTEDQSGDLLARWRQGDQQAAQVIFQRYADRLIELARRRLPAKLSQRLDPEDVVQSVYRSFFAEARIGRYEIQRGGDLWRLLVAIMLHKLSNQVGRNTASKRTVNRESSLGQDDRLSGIEAQALAKEPSPMEALALADEVQQVMHKLDPLQRRIFELRLQGYNLDEIAADTHYTQRTVCRGLERIKHELEQRRLGGLDS